jgi:hypothetical protein
VCRVLLDRCTCTLFASPHMRPCQHDVHPQRAVVPFQPPTCSASSRSAAAMLVLLLPPPLLP